MAFDPFDFAVKRADATRKAGQTASQRGYAMWEDEVRMRAAEERERRRLAEKEAKAREQALKKAETEANRLERQRINAEEERFRREGVDFYLRERSAPDGGVLNEAVPYRNADGSVRYRESDLGLQTVGGAQYRVKRDQWGEHRYSDPFDAANRDLRFDVSTGQIIARPVGKGASTLPDRIADDPGALQDPFMQAEIRAREAKLIEDAKRDQEAAKRDAERESKRAQADAVRAADIEADELYLQRDPLSRKIRQTQDRIEELDDARPPSTASTEERKRFRQEAEREKASLQAELKSVTAERDALDDRINQARRGVIDARRTGLRDPLDAAGSRTAPSMGARETGPALTPDANQRLQLPPTGQAPVPEARLRSEEFGPPAPTAEQILANPDIAAGMTLDDLGSTIARESADLEAQRIYLETTPRDLIGPALFDDYERRRESLTRAQEIANNKRYEKAAAKFEQDRRKLTGVRQIDEAMAAPVGERVNTLNKLAQAERAAYDGGVATADNVFVRSDAGRLAQLQSELARREEKRAREKATPFASQFGVRSAVENPAETREIEQLRQQIAEIASNPNSEAIFEAAKAVDPVEQKILDDVLGGREKLAAGYAKLKAREAERQQTIDRLAEFHRVEQGAQGRVLDSDMARIELGRMNPYEFDRLARRADVQDFGSFALARATSQATLGLGESVLNAIRAVNQAVLGTDLPNARENADFLNRIAAEIPNEIQSYQDVRSVGDAWQYVQNAVGQVAPSLAASAVTAGAGGAAAGALTRAAGLSARAAAFTEAAALASRAGKATLAARFAANADKITNLGKWMNAAGIGAGAFTGSALQEIGSIYGDIERGGGIQAPWTALGFGSVAAALDAVTPGRVAGRILTKGAAKGAQQSAWRAAVTGAFKAAAKDMSTEAATEVAQTGLELMARAAADETFDLVTPENAAQLIDAALMGFIGGGMAGLSGAREGLVDRQALQRELQRKASLKPLADTAAAALQAMPPQLVAEAPTQPLRQEALDLVEDTPNPIDAAIELTQQSLMVDRLQKELSAAEAAGDVRLANDLTEKLINAQMGLVSASGQVMLARDLERAAADIRQMSDVGKQDAVRAAIKLANGRALTSAETGALGFFTIEEEGGGKAPVAVPGPNGGMILTDAGLKRIRQISPAAGRLLPRSEQAQIEKAQAAAEPPAEKPAATPKPAKQVSNEQAQPQVTQQPTAPAEPSPVAGPAAPASSGESAPTPGGAGTAGQPSTKGLFRVKYQVADEATGGTRKGAMDAPADTIEEAQEFVRQNLARTGVAPESIQFTGAQQTQAPRAADVPGAAAPPQAPEQAQPPPQEPVPRETPPESAGEVGGIRIEGDASAADNPVGQVRMAVLNRALGELGPALQAAGINRLAFKKGGWFRVDADFGNDAISFDPSLFNSETIEWNEDIAAGTLFEELVHAVDLRLWEEQYNESADGSTSFEDWVRSKADALAAEITAAERSELEGRYGKIDDPFQLLAEFTRSQIQRRVRGETTEEIWQGKPKLAERLARLWEKIKAIFAGKAVSPAIQKRLDALEALVRDALAANGRQEKTAGKRTSRKEQAGEIAQTGTRAPPGRQPAGMESEDRLANFAVREGQTVELYNPGTGEVEASGVVRLDEAGQPYVETPGGRDELDGRWSHATGQRSTYADLGGAPAPAEGAAFDPPMRAAAVPKEVRQREVARALAIMKARLNQGKNTLIIQYVNNEGVKALLGRDPQGHSTFRVTFTDAQNRHGTNHLNFNSLAQAVDDLVSYGYLSADERAQTDDDSLQAGRRRTTQEDVSGLPGRADPRARPEAISRDRPGTAVSQVAQSQPEGSAQGVRGEAAAGVQSESARGDEGSAASVEAGTIRRRGSGASAGAGGAGREGRVQPAEGRNLPPRVRTPTSRQAAARGLAQIQGPDRRRKSWIFYSPDEATAKLEKVGDSYRLRFYELGEDAHFGQFLFKSQESAIQSAAERGFYYFGSQDEATTRDLSGLGAEEFAARISAKNPDGSYAIPTDLLQVVGFKIEGPNAPDHWEALSAEFTRRLEEERDQSAAAAQAQEQSAAAAQAQESQGEPLLVHIKRLGFLPTKDAVYQGELDRIKAAKKGAAQQFFRKNAPDLDVIRQDLVEAGFPFATVNDMLVAVEGDVAGRQETRPSQFGVAEPPTAFARRPEFSNLVRNSAAILRRIEGKKIADHFKPTAEKARRAVDNFVDDSVGWMARMSRAQRGYVDARPLETLIEEAETVFGQTRSKAEFVRAMVRRGVEATRDFLANLYDLIAGAVRAGYASLRDWMAENRLDEWLDVLSAYEDTDRTLSWHRANLDRSLFFSSPQWKAMAKLAGEKLPSGPASRLADTLPMAVAVMGDGAPLGTPWRRRQSMAGLFGNRTAAVDPVRRVLYLEPKTLLAVTRGAVNIPQAKSIMTAIFAAAITRGRGLPTNRTDRRLGQLANEAIIDEMRPTTVQQGPPGRPKTDMQASLMAPVMERAEKLARETLPLIRAETRIQEEAADAPERLGEDRREEPTPTAMERAREAVRLIQRGKAAGQTAFIFSDGDGRTQRVQANPDGTYSVRSMGLASDVRGRLFGAKTPSTTFKGAAEAVDDLVGAGYQLQSSGLEKRIAEGERKAKAAEAKDLIRSGQEIGQTRFVFADDNGRMAALVLRKDGGVTVAGLGEGAARHKSISEAVNPLVRAGYGLQASALQKRLDAAALRRRAREERSAVDADLNPMAMGARRPSRRADNPSLATYNRLTEARESRPLTADEERELVEAERDLGQSFIPGFDATVNRPPQPKSIRTELFDRPEPDQPDLLDVPTGPAPANRVSARARRRIPEQSYAGDLFDPDLFDDRVRSLISQVNADDQDTFRQNIPLAASIARRFGNIPGVEAADIEQEALIGLVGAVQSFNPARGANFATYASIVILNRLRDLYQRGVRRSAEQTILNEPLSEDDDSGSMLDNLAGQSDTTAAVGSSEARRVLGEQIKELPERFQRLALSMLEGKNQTQIAAEFGVSGAAISKMQAQLGEAMRRRLAKRGIGREDFAMGARRPEVSQKKDADYLHAVERGDMETAQKMVDEAARAAGYGIGPAFHGTDAAPFDVFDKSRGKKWASAVGFWFSDSPDVAETFGSRSVRGYLKLNPLQITADQFDSWRDKHFNDRSFWETKKELWESQGYNGLMVKGEPVKIGRFTVPAQNIFAVFHPSQIKSADPVTRDASGRVIPLSERFNLQSNSILYARRPAREKTPGQTDLGLNMPVARQGEIPGTMTLDPERHKAPRFTGSAANRIQKTATAIQEIEEKRGTLREKLEQMQLGDASFATRVLKDPQSVANEFFGGDLDRADSLMPGFKAAFRDSEMNLALAQAALNQLMENVRQSVEKSFGYPAFWQKNRRRLKRFIAELLPTAAHMAVDRIDSTTGKLVFKDFWMRAGLLDADAAKRQGIPLGGIAEGQFFTNKRDKERLRIGPWIPEENGYALERYIAAEQSQEIYDDFHARYPEAAFWLDRYIMPGQEKARIEGPRGIETADFNRYALFDYYKDTPFGELPFVEGYTPDVIAQRTLLENLANLIVPGPRTALPDYRSPARRFKSGAARESGNVKNIFEGFSTRLQQANLEKHRRAFRERLIEEFAIRPDQIPQGEEFQYVPFDATVDQIMRVLARKYGVRPKELTAKQLEPVIGRGGAAKFGKKLVIRREAVDMLKGSFALAESTNWILDMAEGLVDRFNRGLLGVPGTAAVNWTSNEILKGSRAIRQAYAAALYGITGNGSKAKLAMREAGNIVEGMLWRDRLIGANPEYAKFIQQSIPRELFDNQTMLEEFGKTQYDSVRKAILNLDPGGAALELLHYKDIDTRQKQQLALSMYLAHADADADLRGVPKDAASRRRHAEQFIRQAPRELHRQIYEATVLWLMDYQNVPFWLKTDAFSNASPVTRQAWRIARKLSIPFYRYAYNVARQTKRWTWDSARELIGKGRTKEQRIEAAANMAMYATLIGMAATVRGAFAGLFDDDEDEPTSEAVKALRSGIGTDLDAKGNVLEYPLRTGNRVNVTPAVQMAGAMLKMAGLDVFDRAADENEFWLRYRNFPFAREAFLLAGLAPGLTDSTPDEFREIMSDYVAIGMLPDVALTLVGRPSEYDSGKPVPYIMTDKALDLTTAPLMPNRWRETAATLIDPVSRRSRPSKAYGFEPGASAAAIANTPFATRMLPAAGRPLEVRETGSKSRDPYEDLAALRDKGIGEESIFYTVKDGRDRLGVFPTIEKAEAFAAEQGLPASKSLYIAYPDPKTTGRREPFETLLNFIFGLNVKPVNKAGREAAILDTGDEAE